MVIVLVNFSFTQVIRSRYLLALIYDVYYQLKCVLPQMGSKAKDIFSNTFEEGRRNEIFFLKSEVNNLHFKNLNNGTFYKNMLNTLIQGGKKIRKATWNAIARINCVDKFNETSRVFAENSWESSTEMRQKLHLLPAPCFSTEKRHNANKTNDKNCLENT